MCSNDDVVFVGCDSGYVFVFGTANFTLLRNITLPSNCVVSTMLVYGQWLFSGCENGMIYQSDFDTGEQLAEFIGHENIGTVTALTLICNTSCILYSAASDSRLIQWKIYEGSDSSVEQTALASNASTNTVTTTPTTASAIVLGPSPAINIYSPLKIVHGDALLQISNIVANQEGTYLYASVGDGLDDFGAIYVIDIASLNLVDSSVYIEPRDVVVNSLLGASSPTTAGALYLDHSSSNEMLYAFRGSGIIEAWDMTSIMT